MKTASALPALALAAATAVLSACASAPDPRPTIVFDATAFAWSVAPGMNEIHGQVAYLGGGRSWACAGAVGLTPETVWTRQRFQTLYGSSQRAALPAAVVRARTVAEASADYRTFVRDTTCDDEGRFAFSGLPDGDWYLIVPVVADGAEPVVLMRRVETRGGRVAMVALD